MTLNGYAVIDATPWETDLRRQSHHLPRAREKLLRQLYIRRWKRGPSGPPKKRRFMRKGL